MDKVFLFLIVLQVVILWQHLSHSNETIKHSSFKKGTEMARSEDKKIRTFRGFKEAEK